MNIFKKLFSKEKRLSSLEYHTKVDQLLCLAEKTLPKIYMQDIPSAVDDPSINEWYDFEVTLLRLGQDIYDISVKNKRTVSIKDAERILRICLNKNGKRGRISFVPILAKKRFIRFAMQMEPLIADKDIGGLTVNALFRMGAYCFTERVRPLLLSDDAYTRKEAKRYIQRFENYKPTYGGK